MASSSLTRDWTLGPLHWEHEVLAPGCPGKSPRSLFRQSTWGSERSSKRRPQYSKSLTWNISRKNCLGPNWLIQTEKKDETLRTGSQSRFKRSKLPLWFSSDTTYRWCHPLFWEQGSLWKNDAVYSHSRKKDFTFLKTLQFFQNITYYLGHDLIKKKKKHSPNKLIISKFSLQSL